VPPLSHARTRAEMRELVEPLRHVQWRKIDGAEVYRGVYRHRDEYRARVRFFGKLVTVANRRTALEAAACLADWLAARLGPRWGEIVRAHKKHLWSHAPWRVRHSDAHGGWVACVWVCGGREECVRLRRSYRRWRRTGELMVWRTREEAAAGVFAWLDRAYGLLAPFVLDRGPAAKFHAATA
jgi:hypothetical protein